MRFLNDFAIGQFFPGTSIVHRLDPRAKLLVALVVMISLFARNRWLDVGVWTVIALVTQKLSRIPIRVILKNLRPFLWIFVITFALQIFLVKAPESKIIPIGAIQIRVAAITMAAFYSSRLVLFIVFSALLTLTTSPLELADGLQKLLKPFQKLRVPVHEMALMTSIAVRFIPTIIEEAQRLQKAQMARGARFEGSLVRRIHSLIPLILPLFLSTIRRAEDLANAMEARCYDSRAKRTSFKQLVWRKQESILLSSILILVIILTLF